MVTSGTIDIQRVAQSRLKEVDFSKLEFGKYISDHMAVASYSKGAWGKPAVVPYGEMSMSPAMLALHYGQSVFEGMKAFHMVNGDVNIFRIKKHHERLNKSLNRMCMPEISEDLFVNALKTLIEVDHEWIPTSEGASLYIRPIVFATETRLGVKVSDQYKMVIMTTPVGQFFSQPYKLKIEDHYTRTAEGGTGFAKCAGNYGGAFYPTQVAKNEGFDQVLWTDHKDHQYIDEVGMMNVMFVLDGKIITPQLNTAILDGVTRDSILMLGRELNYPIEERRISVKEIEAGLSEGKLTEAFGVGTAAVVAPIASMNIHGKSYNIPAPNESSFQIVIKKLLLEIRTGLREDKHNWNFCLSIK